MVKAERHAAKITLTQKNFAGGKLKIISAMPELPRISSLVLAEDSFGVAPATSAMIKCCRNPTAAF
jgi:hypothetical protein